MSGSDSARCWVLTDGAAGNVRQAEALAAALGLPGWRRDLDLRAPWSWLAPHLNIGSRHAPCFRDGSTLAPPWPQVAIGCGRRAALVTRGLRAWSEGKTFCVQILDPRIASAHFDVVVAPHHDELAGANVITTAGALNPVDAAWLEAARARFAQFASLPAPRTAVLIGGPHADLAHDDAYFAALLAALDAVQARDGGSLLVSTSRRTDARRSAFLAEHFGRHPGLFHAATAQGENPYPGLLAWADRIVVTADSVNMVSEALATGKPVAAFAHGPACGKLGRFLASVGMPVAAPGELLFHTPPTPLRETARVAGLIAARLQARSETAASSLAKSRSS